MEPSSDECWAKCLKHLPVFTLNNTNLHRLSSRKDKNTVISKTLERIRKFTNEGYLCSDSIFAKCTKNISQLKQNAVLV